MKKQFKLKSLFYGLLLAFLLPGCEKDVTNVKLPETKPKLVVGCFLSPQDTVLEVSLTRSVPVFNSNSNNWTNPVVTDAAVSLSNGSSSVTLVYNSYREKYEIPASAFPIAAGQTYSLTVITPSGETVTANCTVPSSSISSLIVDFIDTSTSERKVNIRWTDIPNQVNYYRVFAQVVFADPYQGDTIYNPMYADNHLYHDQGRDGKEMAAKLEGYAYPGEIIGYDFYIMNIDAGYYKYYTSLENYTYDDPFSEPSPIYTNIDGGLGIFAGYQKYFVRKI